MLSKLSTDPVVIQKGNTELANHTNIIQVGGSPGIFWNYYRTRRYSEEITEMCELSFQWLNKKEKTDRVKQVRMEIGDCFLFNDQKILHGRTTFKANFVRQRILLQSMWRRADSIGKPKVNR